jgi:hypothetical protein
MCGFHDIFEKSQNTWIIDKHDEYSQIQTNVKSLFIIGQQYILLLYAYKYRPVAVILIFEYVHNLHLIA